MMDFNTTPMPADMALFIGINGNNRGCVVTESDYYDAIDREFIEDSPFFSDLAAYRSNLKLRRFTINENVYFEYWGRLDAYNGRLLKISQAADRKGIRASELKAVLAKCKVLLSAFSSSNTAA